MIAIWVAPRPSVEEEKQIPPDKTPERLPTGSGQVGAGGMTGGGQGALISATVPALKSSHDPSASVGMTSQERGRGGKADPLLALHVVPTGRRTNAKGKAEYQ